jgi:hypothetical protein
MYHLIQHSKLYISLTKCIYVLQNGQNKERLFPQIALICKVQGAVQLKPAMKAQRGTTGIALLFL